MVHLILFFYCVCKKLRTYLKVSFWMPPRNKRLKNIQDIRNKIDYDRLFPYEKDTFLSSKQRHLQLLYIDSLTGIYNRRYYDEHFQGANDIQAMVVIDVDNFKHINDNYGHDVGDIVLQSIAQTVLSCVRKTDVVIRYGGDEFVIIFLVYLQIYLRKNWRGLGTLLIG